MNTTARFKFDSLGDIARMFEDKAHNARHAGKGQMPGNTADQLSEREARTYELCASYLRASTLTEFDIEEAKSNAGEAAIDGFLFGRDRKKPAVHDLSTSLDGLDHVIDDGKKIDIPEDMHDKPLCRMVYAVDRGDPSVGIPSRESFVLAEDQTGTLFPYLIEVWNICR